MAPPSSSPSRAGAWKLLSDNLEYTYKTDNFAIHYNRGVRRPASPRISPICRLSRKSAAHPLYVMDIGRYLEEARLNLPPVRPKVSRPLMIRYDALLAPMTEFGSSELGGPILLDNDFSLAAALVSSHLEYQMGDHRPRADPRGPGRLLQHQQRRRVLLGGWK